ncbi:MAG: hypothetical protein HYY76_09815 [Acidobacteria bacterium]|nr:hypothetical protein [Acidobacteriota bacterium]
MTRRFLVALLLAAGVGSGSPAAQRAPAPAPVNLPPEVISLACAPGLAVEPPPTPIRVTGAQDSDIRRNFAPGDLVTINAGTDNGIDVGQEYYTRRAVPLERRAISRDNPATIRTTGWIRIYAVDRRMSLATIVHPCDSIELNDYLEPFVLPQLTATSAIPPMPQRGNYGRVVAGNDSRTAFGRGDYFVVDRGSDHGVAVGSQFVVYRDHQRRERLLLERTDDGRDNEQPRNFLFELGEAVAVEVRPDSSTLLVTLSRDAFIVGDWVALRK